MHCAPVVEEAVELIAVVAVVVGALLVVIAMGALVDDGLRQRTVHRCQGSVQPHSQGLCSRWQNRHA